MAPTSTSWFAPARRVSRFGVRHILAATGAVAVVAAGVVALTNAFMVEPVRDCPSHISILIDPSDPLPPDRVMGHLKNLTDQSCLGTRVMLAAITSDPTKPLRMETADLVDPGRPEEHWRLIKNHRSAERERRDRFLAPLDIAIADALERPIEPSKSPLIEALASYSHLPRANTQTAHDLTVVVSDLLQNSACSFVAKSKRRAPLLQRCQEVTASHPAKLQGEFLILLVRRPSSHAVPQDADFERFWTDYLMAAGASKVVWREIS